jgi:hypothetical protein
MQPNEAEGCAGGYLLFRLRLERAGYGVTGG